MGSGITAYYGHPAEAPPGARIISRCQGPSGEDLYKVFIPIIPRDSARRDRRAPQLHSAAVRDILRTEVIKEIITDEVADFHQSASNGLHPVRWSKLEEKMTERLAAFEAEERHGQNRPATGLGASPCCRAGSNSRDETTQWTHKLFDSDAGVGKSWVSRLARKQATPVGGARTVESLSSRATLDQLRKIQRSGPPASYNLPRPTSQKGKEKSINLAEEVYDVVPPGLVERSAKQMPYFVWDLIGHLMPFEANIMADAAGRT
ncbi:hypothetical protein PG984_002694 [Apiospora sp. TS-2023a]